MVLPIGLPSLNKAFTYLLTYLLLLKLHTNVVNNMKVGDLSHATNDILSRSMTESTCHMYIANFDLNKRVKKTKIAELISRLFFVFVVYFGHSVGFFYSCVYFSVSEHV